MGTKNKMSFKFVVAIAILLLIAIVLSKYFGHSTESFIVSDQEYQAFYNRIGVQMPVEIGQLITTKGYPAAAFSRMPNFRNEFFAMYPDKLAAMAITLDYPNVLVDIVSKNQSAYRPFFTSQVPFNLQLIRNFAIKYPTQYSAIASIYGLPTMAVNPQMVAPKITYSP